MNLIIERPYAFLGLLILIPGLVYMFVKYKKLVRSFSYKLNTKKSVNLLSRFNQRYIGQSVCRALAWVMLICAFAGISWGTRIIPVQKSGNAICFVFDISYSMEAHDAAGGLTRLESAANYAETLLAHLTNESVSVVIAKGDGTVVIPLTEDKRAVISLLDSLTPTLMTSEGTSLGKGIETAINSFPQQSVQAENIWLFTDGDETDGSLGASLTNAVKYGIPVTIIGFGSERETEILAGDRKTSVKTALRSGAIKSIIDNICKKSNRSEKEIRSYLKYIDSTEVGSATKLLNSLHTDPMQTETELDDNTVALAYETQNIERKNLFLALMLFFFILSFILSEIKGSKVNGKTTTIMLVCLSVIGLTGCEGRFADGAKLLQGKMEWNRQNYQQAITKFLQVSEDAAKRNDKDYEMYAVFNLASTYMMQEENEAAIKRFNQIIADSPENVKFAVYYNLGIIAHGEGEYAKAKSFFKEALCIDSTNINAKINLELSIQQDAVQTKIRQQNIEPVSQSNEEQSVENIIFSIIRENDQNQWKNQQKETSNTSKDY